MIIKDEWEAANDTILGFPAIRTKHEINLPRDPIEHELTLAGKWGEIWVKNSTHVSCVVKSAIVANKLILGVGTSSRKYKRGEEALLTFPNSELSRLIKALKIPKSRAWQVFYANRFNVLF